MESSEEPSSKSFSNDDDYWEVVSEEDSSLPVSSTKCE
jgi:hypothetical protein